METSGRRYGSAPAWSSCAWVRTTPSTRSALSRRYVKSGSTRSTPGIAGSGNISPQSTTRMRSSTSRQKQFLPISPSPPRKTRRTAPLIAPNASDRHPCVSQPRRARLRYASEVLRARGFAVLRDLVEGRVLFAGVGPVLELDHAQLGEALPQPAVTGIEQTELLTVGHDLRDQHRLEHLALRRLHHDVDRVLDVDAKVVPHLLLEEPVAHAHGGLERELLALADLGG